MKHISYLVDPDSGQIWSRVGSYVAVPVLDFESMKPENNFTPTYYLEKFQVMEVAHQLNSLSGTRLIPTGIKNKHREFWGMKPLKAKKQGRGI